MIPQYEKFKTLGALRPLIIKEIFEAFWAEGIDLQDRIY